MGQRSLELAGHPKIEGGSKYGFRRISFIPSDTRQASPVEGAVEYDDSENALKVYDGSAWNALPDTAAAQTFASAVTFTIGQQSAAVARTATADGTGTGTIADGATYVTVTAGADANSIIVLPTPTPGNVVWLNVGATGYELRSSAPATVAINGGTGAGAESAVGANVLVRCVCTSATTWVCSTFSTIGTEAALEAAA